MTPLAAFLARRLVLSLSNLSLVIAHWLGLMGIITGWPKRVSRKYRWPWILKVFQHRCTNAGGTLRSLFPCFPYKFLFSIFSVVFNSFKFYFLVFWFFNGLVFVKGFLMFWRYLPFKIETSSSLRMGILRTPCFFLKSLDNVALINLYFNYEWAEKWAFLHFLRELVTSNN